MLDKNDLQAIGELIHAEVSASETRTAKKIEEACRNAVRDAVSQAIAYSENTVETKLDLIKEGLDLALEVLLQEGLLLRWRIDVLQPREGTGEQDDQMDGNCKYDSRRR